MIDSISSVVGGIGLVALDRWTLPSVQRFVWPTPRNRSGSSAEADAAGVWPLPPSGSIVVALGDRWNQVGKGVGK